MKIAPIGLVHSCFKQKFGIPRQSGLSKRSQGHLEIFKEFSHPGIIRGLDSFSHIWVIFNFHLIKNWRPTVRPPRLGGKEKIGLFASRTPFRPNPVGMSILQLEDINFKSGIILIKVSGLDILDQTPIIDIKPYIPSIDSIPLAKPGWVDSHPPIIENVTVAEGIDDDDLELVKELIYLDPRPAHQKNKEKDFKMSIRNKDYHFRVKDKTAEILKVLD